MTPWLQDPDVTLFHGDNLDVLRTLPDRSVHMCATSPPFYGLRDYGTGEWEGGQPDCDHQRQSEVSRQSSTLVGSATTQGGTYAYGQTCGKCGARRVDQQIGLEETPDQWVERLVAVFREVRRVLRDEGTLWVEVGDSYNSRLDGSFGNWDSSQTGKDTSKRRGGRNSWSGTWKGAKAKDLLGQPWLLAFALRADGWYLRSEIIWARPNPMPESVTDRPTKSHSTVFLLSKQPRYFYDADAIREDAEYGRRDWNGGVHFKGGDVTRGHDGTTTGGDPSTGRNARSVWTIPTQPTPFAHFATWPEALCRRMILAGTSERGCCPECGAPWVRDTEQVDTGRRQKMADGWDTGEGGHGTIHRDGRQAGEAGIPVLARATTGWSPSCTHPLEPVPCTVLDPFAGSATTNLVARHHGRHSIGIELNEDYLKIAAKRLQQLSLLAEA